MKIYLAGVGDKPFINVDAIPNVLESFFYFQGWEERYLNKWDFLLDSGAFTFMNNGKNADLNSYVDRYIEFINRYNIDKFFEMDVDSVKGLEWVEQKRQLIEAKTNKKSIPVWHITRGLKYWENLCEEYDYIAIGGIVTKGIKKKDYDRIFPPLLRYAHKKKVKVHGLGLTAMDAIKKYSFDSVDSTAWKSGGRFGQLHQFDKNKGIIAQLPQPSGTRAKDYKQIDYHNANEWIKFQEYMKNK